jgi:antitoxin PrlF
MARATVTSKGQVTIPIEVRKRLGIHTGTSVDFAPREDGTFEFLAATGSIADIRGMFSRPGATVTVEEMDEAISAAAAEKYQNL